MESEGSGLSGSCRDKAREAAPELLCMLESAAMDGTLLDLMR